MKPLTPFPLRYCANEIHQGRKFIHSGNIILYYHTTSRYSRGWEAQVRFLPIAGCRTQGKAGTEKPVLPEELARTVFSGMTIFSLNTAVNKLLPPKGDSKCGLLEDLGNVYWNSPLFGFEKYPQNSSCFFTLVPVSCYFLASFMLQKCIFSSFILLLLS